MSKAGASVTEKVMAESRVRSSDKEAEDVGGKSTEFDEERQSNAAVRAEKMKSAASSLGGTKKVAEASAKQQLANEPDDAEQSPEEQSTEPIRIKIDTGQMHAHDEASAFDQFAVFDEPELVFEGAAASRHRTPAQIDYDRLAVPRRIVYLQGAILGLASLFFFSMGWWMGSSGNRQVQVAQQECEVSGSILYQSSEGKLVDEGAVVIFLPTERRPQNRPDAQELLPGKLLTSQNDSVRIIREMGGDVGSVSGDGKFELRLGANRDYYMCVLSKHQARGDAAEISKQVRAEIGTYFLPIESLTSRQEFRWQTVKLQGKKQSVGEIVF
jgi:hypothetical protein